jgi:F-type H+-transporting ATPase subunit delta
MAGGKAETRLATVTSTYARAFADVVMDRRLDPTGTMRETRALAALVAESSELRQVWETPSIPAEQKRAVLDAIAAREQISRPVRNFVAVLIDHGRINFLQAIVTQFQQELYRRMGYSEAEITSARELSPPERAALEDEVGKLTGTKIMAHYRQDSGILGGAIVRVGSTIYDGSVKGKLERIRAALSS